jgi:hypothetical protein
MTSGTDVVHSNPASTPHASPILFRLLPSISDLIFILLLLSFACGSLSKGLLGDAGIGWHIRNGQNILAAHAIPHTDSFSATMAGRPWYAWEWLYDLGIGFVHKHLGLNGVLFFTALVIALTLTLVFRYTLQRGANVGVTILLTLICTVASSIHFLARPHVVGWLLTIVWFWIVDSSHPDAQAGRSRHHLFWLPLLMVVWVNMHGSFVLGFLLLGIFLLADGLKLLKCRDPEQRKPAVAHIRGLSLALALSALASIINPYGYKLHAHVYQYLTSRFLMQHIDEFRRPNFHGLPAQFFLLMLLATFIGIVVAKGKLRWAEWLVILFSTLSGFYAARNLPVASMLLTMVAAPLLSQAGAVQSRFSRLAPAVALGDNLERRLRTHLWPVLVLVLSLWVCIQHGRLLGKQVMDAQFDPTRFPIKAVEVLQQRGLHEPVFSIDSWGGYLIYQLSPQAKVFIDDRHDFYGEQFLKDYLKVFHAQPDWEKVLDQWGVNLVLVPSKSAIGSALKATEGWTLDYQDNVALLFRRRRTIMARDVNRPLSSTLARIDVEP